MTAVVLGAFSYHNSSELHSTTGSFSTNTKSTHTATEYFDSDCDMAEWLASTAVHSSCIQMKQAPKFFVSQ